MDRDLADLYSWQNSVLLTEISSLKQKKQNINPGFYKDNMVHGKYVLYSDVSLYPTHGIKTWSDSTECEHF